MKTLSEQFQASKGQSIEIDGKDIFPIFCEAVTEEMGLSLRWIETSSSVKQGVQVKLDRGTLEINGQQSSNVILWEDTCPAEVLIRCKPQNSSKLKIWNVWEIDDLVQAWVGNAGMDISLSGNKVLLKCSDGIGAVDFNNLILEVARP